MSCCCWALGQSFLPAPTAIVDQRYYRDRFECVISTQPHARAHTHTVSAHTAMHTYLPTFLWAGRLLCGAPPWWGASRRVSTGDLEVVLTGTFRGDMQGHFWCILCMCVFGLTRQIQANLRFTNFPKDNKGKVTQFPTCTYTQLKRTTRLSSQTRKLAHAGAQTTHTERVIWACPYPRRLLVRVGRWLWEWWVLLGTNVSEWGSGLTEWVRAGDGGRSGWAAL